MRVPTFLLKLRGVLFITRSMFQGNSVHDTITVFGPTEFRRQMTEALSLLQAKAPDAYELLTKHVSSVVLSSASCVLATNRPAMILMGRNSLNERTSLDAMGLAHEAYHCKLYWDYKDVHPNGRVPPEVFSGREAELKCIAYQLDVLRNLGESEDLIQAATESAEREISREFWKIPWEHRTW